MLGPSYLPKIGAALVFFGAAVTTIFPEWARYGALISAFGSAFGLVFSRQNNVSSEEAGAKAVISPLPPK